jgi:uncharacterized membrane protein YoaK (UPF0700 family)
MAAQLLHRLTAPERTQRANRQLGGVLTFVAGAINAGGFLAVQRYTSHMTGIVSSIADNLVIGEMLLAVAGLACLLAFVLGAITSAVLVNWGRRRHLHGEFALPLMVEAALLCFIMGLQNAMVTNISKAEIRIHLTILGLFFSGCLIGAMAFKTLGFSATLPFALLLTGMAALPLLSDLRGKLGHA